MSVRGWVREQDGATCGGTVIEGDSTTLSEGRSYAFQGARMACRKNCVIAEGYPLSTLANGCSQVIHGMQTSGGCRLVSTLNNVDGVGDESGTSFATAAGGSAAVQEARRAGDQFDEQTKLAADPIAGVPYFIETTDGRKFSGRTGADGLLPRIHSSGEDEYTVLWGDDALARMDEVQS